MNKIMGERRMKIVDLARIADININTARSLYYGNTVRIDYDVLNKLCRSLNLLPGDILEYIPDEEKETESC